MLYTDAMLYELMRFKKVVEVGSISKASRLLFVSQPALSKSIGTLEDTYGVALLERHTWGVRPTVYGSILYRAACNIERSYLNIEDEIFREKSLREPAHSRQEIDIGCSTIWNDFLLPQVLKTIKKIDTFEIHVTNDTSEQLLDDLLEKQRYDLVLCRILEDEKYMPLQSFPLLETQAAVFVSEHHPFFETDLDTQKLQELKWVKLKSLPILTRTDLTPAGLSIIPKGYLSTAISFEVDDLMAAIQLLQHNHAIILPRALAGLLAEYSIKPLPFPHKLTNSYWLGIVCSPNREAPFYVRELINSIRLFFSKDAPLRTE